MILDNQSGSRNVGDEDVIRLEEYSSAVSSGEFEKKNRKERKLTFSAIFIYNNILTYQYRVIFHFGSIVFRLLEFCGKKSHVN